jgi:hypothetical protein
MDTWGRVAQGQADGVEAVLLFIVCTVLLGAVAVGLAWLFTKPNQ